MKLRLIILTLLIASFHFSFAQKSDLAELVGVIRTSTIARLNTTGHKLGENAQVPIVFLDGKAITVSDSLSRYKLSDVKSITYYINGDLKQSEVFKGNPEQDASLSALYGDIVRTAGIILIRTKER